MICACGQKAKNNTMCNWNHTRIFKQATTYRFFTGQNLIREHILLLRDGNLEFIRTQMAELTPSFTLNVVPTAWKEEYVSRKSRLCAKLGFCWELRYLSVNFWKQEFTKEKQNKWISRVPSNCIQRHSRVWSNQPTRAICYKIESEREKIKEGTMHLPSPLLFFFYSSAKQSLFLL